MDELLSGAGMLGNTNASVFGSFRVGNTTLPQVREAGRNRVRANAAVREEVMQ